MLKKISRFFSLRKGRKKVKYNNYLNNYNPNKEIIENLYFNRDNNLNDKIYHLKNDNNFEEVEVENDINNFITNDTNLIMLLKTINNNTILIRTILKYYKWLNYNVLIEFLNKLDDNFDNLEKFEQEEIEKYNKKKEYLKSKSLDVDIKYSHIFLNKEEFLISQEFIKFLFYNNNYINNSNKNILEITIKMKILTVLYNFDKHILKREEYVKTIISLLNEFSLKLDSGHDSLNFNSINSYLNFVKILNINSIIKHNLLKENISEFLMFFNDKDSLDKLNFYSVMNLYNLILYLDIKTDLITDLNVLITNNINIYSINFKMIYINNSLKFDKIYKEFFEAFIYSSLVLLNNLKSINWIKDFIIEYNKYIIKNNNLGEFNNILNIFYKGLEKRIFSHDLIDDLLKNDEFLYKLIDLKSQIKIVEKNKLDIISKYLTNNIINKKLEINQIKIYCFLVNSNYYSNALVYTFDKLIFDSIKEYYYNLENNLQIEGKIENNLENPDFSINKEIMIIENIIMPFKNILSLFLNFTYCIENSNINQEFFNWKNFYESIDSWNKIIEKKMLLVENNYYFSYILDELLSINYLLKKLKLNGLGLKYLKFNINNYIFNYNYNKLLVNDKEIIFDLILKKLEFKKIKINDDLSAYDILFENKKYKIFDYNHFYYTYTNNNELEVNEKVNLKTLRIIYKNLDTIDFGDFYKKFNSFNTVNDVISYFPFDIILDTNESTIIKNILSKNKNLVELEEINNFDIKQYLSEKMEENKRLNKSIELDNLKDKDITDNIDNKDIYYESDSEDYK